MPNLIIIRLHPAKPMNGAAFRDYLTGLSITVSDMSVANPLGANNPIGTAFYDPHHPASTIVQHVMPLTKSASRPLAAVATAVIVVPPAKEPPAYAEYVTSDLRLTITRGGQRIVDRSLHYNVGVDAHIVPANHDPLQYAALQPVALYLALPSPGVGLDPDRAYLEVPADGTPPPYDELLAAVQKVYARDPGGVFGAGSPLLTPAQARHIAREILYNRDLDPLPAAPPSQPIEALYTMPGADSLNNERQQFESDLTTYYTTHDTQAEVLAKYVLALSVALACERRTDDATRAGLALPVLPGVVETSGKTAETDVVLSG